MTTRAFSKSVVVGVVPPNSPTATRSYSNGRFIHFLEAVVRDGLAVDRHQARVEGERRLAARRRLRFAADGEGAGQQRQRDRRVGLYRNAMRIGVQFAPALRLLQTRAGRAAEVRHVGDDLQRVAVPFDFRTVKLGLDAG